MISTERSVGKMWKKIFFSSKSAQNVAVPGCDLNNLRLYIYIYIFFIVTLKKWIFYLKKNRLLFCE